MIEGFARRRFDGSDAPVNYATAGDGPPLLLLHGYPQTHIMWRKIAPRLAADFNRDARTCAATAILEAAVRQPARAYSKRAMARRPHLRLMSALGQSAILPPGTTRAAGRHRLTLTIRRASSGSRCWISCRPSGFPRYRQGGGDGLLPLVLPDQEAPFPETLIGNSVEFYLRTKLGRWGAGAEMVEEEAFADYLRCFSDPATIHASCEDYRAAATIDLEHDAADLDRRIECPMLVLWGERGLMHRHFDVPGTWRERASDVSDALIPCGHFLPEEAPDETFRALHAFFSAR